MCGAAPMRILRRHQMTAFPPWLKRGDARGDGLSSSTLKFRDNNRSKIIHISKCWPRFMELTDRFKKPITIIVI